MRLFKFLPKDYNNFFVHTYIMTFFFFVIQCAVARIKRVGCTCRILISITAVFAVEDVTIS